VKKYNHTFTSLSTRSEKAGAFLTTFPVFLPDGMEPDYIPVTIVNKADKYKLKGEDIKSKAPKRAAAPTPFTGST